MPIHAHTYIYIYTHKHTYAQLLESYFTRIDQGGESNIKKGGVKYFTLFPLQIEGGGVFRKREVFVYS